MSPTAKTTVPPALVARREELGAIDAQLIALLSRRIEIARRIGDEKRAAGLATLDPRREAQVVAAAARRARQAGLSEEAVRDIFWPIVEMCRKAQQDDGA